MKRSEAITKLMPKCISHYEILRKENYDSGEYRRRAEQLLDFIEKELGMLPPERLHYYDEDAKVRGEGFKRDRTWEPED